MRAFLAGVMAYARLEEALLDHPKVFGAGAEIGRDGPVIALGFFALAVLWSNKHLSDGHLSDAVIRSFAQHVHNPVAVADALVTAGLFERNGKGYLIHDYGDYNMWAATVKRRRRKNRDRMRAERALKES